MFILDSLFLAGFRWVLDTITTAAEAELNDDSAMRERLLEAEMRRETGELSDEAFAAIEAELLARIRDIKARREGGSGPISFDSRAIEVGFGSELSVEATVAGDFHEPPAAPVPFEHQPVTADGDSGTRIAGPLVEPSTHARDGAAPRARAARRKGAGAHTRARRASRSARSKIRS